LTAFFFVVAFTKKIRAELIGVKQKVIGRREE